jgi:hypothetical protein
VAGTHPIRPPFAIWSNELKIGRAIPETFSVARPPGEPVEFVWTTLSFVQLDKAYVTVPAFTFGRDDLIADVFSSDAENQDGVGIGAVKHARRHPILREEQHDTVCLRQKSLPRSPAGSHRDHSYWLERAEVLAWKLWMNLGNGNSW